jgi:hypothetical protein
LLDVQSAALRVDLGKECRLEGQLQFADEAAAKRALPAVQDGLALLRIFGLGAALDAAGENVQEAPSQKEEEKRALWLAALPRLATALRTALVDQEQNTVQVSAHLSLSLAVLQKEAKAALKAMPPPSPAVLARLRSISDNNLKQIGLPCTTSTIRTRVCRPRRSTARTASRCSAGACLYCRSSSNKTCTNNSNSTRPGTVPTT